MMINKKIRKIFSTVILIYLFNSFVFKANCFETNELNFAKTSEIGIAALKLPMAIAANIYAIKRR